MWMHVRYALKACDCKQDWGSPAIRVVPLSVEYEGPEKSRSGPSIRSSTWEISRSQSDYQTAGSRETFRMGLSVSLLIGHETSLAFSGPGAAQLLESTVMCIFF